MSYIDALPDDWRDQLAGSDGLKVLPEIEAFVRRERIAYPEKVYPKEDEVFAALRRTRFRDVRAVILGMDPYHGPTQAHGLAFSLRPGASRFPSSLRNILNELERDVGDGPVDRSGSLEPWCDNGVLLLNAALTVRHANPGSHLKDWRPFTKAVVEAMNRAESTIVFMLWGRRAEAFRGLVDESLHEVQVRSHPSGLSAGLDVRRTSPFSDANRALMQAGRQPIDWRLPVA